MVKNMINFIATKLKDRRFNNHFYYTLINFQYEAWYFLYYDKGHKGINRTSHTDYTKYLSTTKDIALEIKEICSKNKMALNYFSSALFSETILMQKIVRDYSKNKISMENDVIKESVFEIQVGFNRAMKDYTEMCTVDLKRELEISKDLRIHRENLIRISNKM